VLDSHTTVTDNLNPHQLKVNHMNDVDYQLAQRAVDALEAIAEHMGVLATMALSNSTQAVQTPATEQPAKRKPGRPRKDAAPSVTATLAAAALAPAAPPPPSDAERAEAFGKLKAALKDCLALHGEEVARQRLQFPKFSEVPYEAIDATIERLAA
jgi:hypothetical protein